MSAAFIFCFKIKVNKLKCGANTNYTTAKAKNVGIVVESGIFCRKMLTASSSTNTLYLVCRKVIKWYIPVSFIATVFVCYLIAGGFDVTFALQHILAGGVFLGAIFQNDLVWELTDMFNNLMVIPNVIALAALSGIVVKATQSAKKK